ncbi:hypothetical protein SAMN04487857_108192 [Pseudomonas sp. ok272]|uniref:hypothetical protein n=1 Tax=unclassified Pseudomonas TaxID=196821 RepID=UPI0008D1933E|nr:MULTISPECIES: hypothetical protein [unclassified Pseudomonas]SEN01724.1 hypothetical protein SAMN04487857_108192 [Pseudomonas sp. ok272]SFM87334.1 hypothetical protein SAMN04487858_10835 [Pseudomonas sp. ok602]
MGKFLLVSEMTFKQRRDFSRWVDEHSVPLLNVLQQPVREVELASVMSVCHEPRVGGEALTQWGEHLSTDDFRNA